MKHSNQVSREEQSYFIGVDIGGTKTAITIGSIEGTILHKEKFSTKDQPSEVIVDIKRAITLCIDKFPVGIKTIGISCGGPLDAKRGIIQSPPNLPNWVDIPIVEILQSEYEIPVFLQNDANACALAEYQWGNGKGCDNLIFLTFGTGIGAGLILNGALYDGFNGLAGEVGHIRLAPEGAECYGKKGSFESFCSGCGLRNMYDYYYHEELSGQEICELADKGDPKASHIIELSAEYLGRGLALLIDILNPERIIIGSIFSRSEHLFRKTMEKYIEEEALEESVKHCTILPSLLLEELGDKAALGVALYSYQSTKE